MLRSLFLAAVLLAATAPAFGDDPKPPATPVPLTERIETLQKELNKKISDLQAEVAALKQQVARIDTQSNVLVDAWEAQNRLETMQAEINRMRDQLAQSGSRSAAPPSTSNYGPSRDGFNRMPEGGRRDTFRMDAPPRESRRPALGYFRVVNDAPLGYEVLVNSQRFFVGAFESVDLPMVPGEFTYQVLGRTALRVSSVGANQIRTATIQP